MAEEQRKITILDFQIKDSDILQRIGEVKKEVRSLREANKELGKSFGDNAVEIAKNEIVIAELGKEERNLKNITAQSVTANKARTGSIQQMRAEYSNLKKQYDQLSKSERESTQAGKAMAAQLETLADEMNAANKNAGSFKDNIGRYPAVFKDAVKSVNVFGVNIGQAGETLKSGAKGFGEFTKGITSTKGALTALVAVPVILVLTAIVALLAKLASATDFVGDRFGQFTAGLGGGFDFLVTKLNDLLDSFDFSEVFGKALDDAKAFAGVFGALVTGDLSGAMDRFGKLSETNLGKLVGGLNNAIASAGALERRLQDLEDAEVANSVAVARADAATTKALIQIKNRNLALKDKIGILDRASEAETKAANEELRIARERQAIAAQAIADGRNQDAEKKKLADATVALLQAESATVNTQEKIANRRAALIESELAARLAASEKAYNIEKVNSERTAQLLEDTLTRELKLFDIGAKDEVRTATKAGEDLNVLRELQARKRADIERKVRDQIAAAEKELQAKLEGYRDAQEKFEGQQQQQQVERANKSLDSALNESDRRFAELETRRKEQVAAGELSSEDAANASLGQRQLQLQTELELERLHSDAVLSNDALGAENRAALLRESGDRQLQLRQKVADTELAIQKKSADDQAKIQQLNFQSAQGFVSGIGSLFEILAGDQEEATQLQKVSALAQIAIDTAKAISALVAAASANPANSVTFGAAGVAQFATGIAQILANIAQAKQLLSSFEQGGMIDTARNSGITLKGRRHRDGGTRIFIEGTGWVEAERGEVLTIVKRTDSAKLSRLSRQNEARGGRAFYESGGAITVNAAASMASQPAFDYAALAAAMAAQPAPIVKVTDINRVQGNVARVTQNGKI